MKNSRPTIENLIDNVKNNHLTELTLSRYANVPLSSPGHCVIAIESLDLDNEDIDLIASIFRSINENHSLKRLNFYHLVFDGKPYGIFNALIEMLIKNSSIESLRFDNTIFGVCYRRSCSYPCQHIDNEEINLSRFLDAITKNTSIRSLKFSDDLLPEYSMSYDVIFETKINKSSEKSIKMKSIDKLSILFTNKGLTFSHILQWMTNKISIKHLEICGKFGQIITNIDKFVFALTDFLNHNPMLYSISIECSDFSKISKKTLKNLFYEALLQHPNIKSITFRGYYLPIEELTLLLSSNTVLEELNLYDCILDNMKMKKLALFIENSPSIKQFSIGNKNTVMNFNPNSNHPGFSQIVTAISKKGLLQNFDLSGNFFDSAALSTLLILLSTREEDISLNLSETNEPFSANNCVDYFAALISQPCVVSFTYNSKDTRSIKLRNEDVEWIAKSMKENKRLRVLDLRNNKIGNKGARMIADAICANRLSGISTVKLGNNPIDDYHLSLVQNAIDEVKKNIALAAKPFDTFASIINDSSRNPYLATELVQHIISFGLFKTLSPYRSSKEINNLLSCIMKDAQNRGIDVNQKNVCFLSK